MTKVIDIILGISLKLIPLRYFLALWHRSLGVKLACLKPEEALTALMFLDNYLYTQTGKYAVTYDDGVHVKHRLTGYVDHFSDLAKDIGGPYLDIGCGRGELAHAIASKSDQNVVGIDILEERIEATRRLEVRPNLKYVLGDATKIDLGRQFKTIVLSNVFEHIADRHAFLTSIQNKYAPERFLIRVPNFERDWRVPLKKELGVEWRLDITHETEHTEAKLRDELEAANLEILKLEIHWGEFWVIAAPKEPLRRIIKT
ncbi:class I SAM-dependent methyltransferase [Curvivirga aplysinae]|uniref:class I SAM-dependent methyltransferase n=1 Tax=Curvivirga aplysinae TaxID=2529852 RepID=UPI0012BCAEAF|nr:class I SAM-dependent methyltransferase [Curvivirga aplysinae]MTI11402.1 class I SAM-dependent methyltransferase [Curvivirga aplysinae]